MRTARRCRGRRGAFGPGWGQPRFYKMPPGAAAAARRWLAVFLCIAAACATARAQQEDSGLDVFGYMQASVGSMQGTGGFRPFNTFSLQQLNVMAGRKFDSRFSMFVNLQFTNSYSSGRSWGSMNVEEGWVKYNAGQALNIKAGLLIPTFNALHQIKNRTPLLPYVFRPFVYESILEDTFNFEAFLPMRAYVEIYGTVSLGSLRTEYAVYVGNSDASSISSRNGAFLVSGMDTTRSKLLGARLGFSNSWVRAGVSFTSDKENHREMGIGPLQRFRFGGDVSVRLAPLTLEGEIIVVKPRLGDQDRAFLQMLATLNPLVGENFDRRFYYGTLLWDVTEEWFAYGTYSYLAGNENKPLSHGIEEWAFGGGWRPIDQIVIKAQFVKIFANNPFNKTDLNNYTLAVSVNF